MHAYELLAEACTTLADATAGGLCRTWGVATWNPAPLLADRHAGRRRCPDTAMAARSAVGMSPFGGDARAPAWQEVAAHAFLQDRDADLTPAAAAFRTAYHLPGVSAIAVGTSNLAHLRELQAALRFRVDGPTVARYRKLLRERAGITAVP
ncbi:hypothetical protein AB0B21_35195 [Streptomyces rimosus]|uniref:hypothetical protein n=1 Tax=Streptomyces rimosus TaxID=1927 RepID=UPI00067C0B2C|nr:hypothetical protein [Streptomyces rimosus]